MPAHVSSSTPAAYEAHHVARDDLWVQIMTDDEPCFWHRVEQTSVWVRSRDGLFFHVETKTVRQSLSGTWHGHGLVTPPVFGAVQVGVHGLVDRVRDGVHLRVLRGLRPCEHAVQVPASVQMTVVVPRLQFIDRVGHCRYATETGFLLV